MVLRVIARGERPLLLRKEWRNAGKRDSSEGVQKRSTVKVGLGEVLAIWGGVFLRIVIPKNYRRSNYGDSRLSSAAIWHEPNTRDSLKKQHRPFFHSAALSVEMVWNARHRKGVPKMWGNGSPLQLGNTGNAATGAVEMVRNARHETIQTYHKTAQMKLHAQNCTHAPKRSRLTTKRHDSLG